MPIFNVPVRQNVPARGEVAVEAASLEEACIKVQEDIDDNGFLGLAGEAEFTTCWQEAFGLTVDDVALPDGRIFSTGD